MKGNGNHFIYFLQRLPIPVCGLTLGLGAVSNLLVGYSGLLHWLYFAVTAVLWLLLVCKLVLCWPQAKQEFANPLTFSVFEAFFMTFLQMAAALEPYFHTMAYGMWVIANIGHGLLVILFSWRFLRRFQLAAVFTTWNVLYGGNMLAAVLSPMFHVEQLGQIIFWVGFILFLPWYPISAYRYWKLPVAEAAQPTLCILAAPFNLMLAAYLSCIAQPDLGMVLLIAVIAQVMYGYVLLRLPGILRLPFYPSYGALTFPFVIPAVAMQKLLTYLTAAGISYPAFLQYVVLLEQAIAVVMVTYVLVRYVCYLARVYQTQSN